MLSALSAMSLATSRVGVSKRKKQANVISGTCQNKCEKVVDIAAKTSIPLINAGSNITLMRSDEYAEIRARLLFDCGLTWKGDVENGKSSSSSNGEYYNS
ncbi:hypothetical protein PV327_001538 [Microctonus hyperodae]|uniref:Uncharacterized protein n=1 Tax=Microctonus hyperodae TaxID=165561 RepID=A0AA39G8Y1_MICHY|nr:hypothetical protein PV327_001538 [Microctonus hyperodae]